MTYLSINRFSVDPLNSVLDTQKFSETGFFAKRRIAAFSHGKKTGL